MHAGRFACRSKKKDSSGKKKKKKINLIMELPKA